MVSAFTESTVEEAALAWLESLGWTVKHGSEIAPGESLAERADYAKVVLEDRLRQALARLNPELPAEALHDALGTLKLRRGCCQARRPWSRARTSRRCAGQAGSRSSARRRSSRCDHRGPYLSNSRHQTLRTAEVLAYD